MLSRRDIEKELGKGINIVPIIRDPLYPFKIAAWF